MTAEEILQTIAEDREHGASHLLQTAFQAVQVFIQDLLPLPGPQRYIKLRGFTLQLLRTRPSMAPLIRLANDLNFLWDASDGNLMEFEAKIQELQNAVQAAEEKAVANAVGALGRFQQVLTHSYSSTVFQFLLRRRPQHVFCTESYPGREGLTLAQELHRHELQVTVVADLGVPSVAGQAQCLVVGADAFFLQGFVNKVGTQILASWAHEQGIPVYVLTTTYKGLPEDLYPFYRTEDAEVEKPEALSSLRWVAPLFDETPWQWVTALITEKGITYPSAVHELLKPIQIHPVLESMIGTELT